MLDQIIFQNVSPLCSVGGLQQCAAMMVVAGKKFFLQQLHSCSPHRLLNSSSVRPKVGVDKLRHGKLKIKRRPCVFSLN